VRCWADDGHQPGGEDRGARSADRPGDHGERDHQRDAGQQGEHADRPLVSEPEGNAVEPDQALRPIDPGDIAVEREAAPASSTLSGTFRKRRRRTMSAAMAPPIQSQARRRVTA
jgi:hypothetical protein